MNMPPEKVFRGRLPPGEAFSKIYICPSGPEQVVKQLGNAQCDFTNYCYSAHIGKEPGGGFFTSGAEWYNPLKVTNSKITSKLVVLPMGDPALERAVVDVFRDESGAGTGAGRAS